MKTYKYMTVAGVLAWCAEQDPDEEIQGIGEMFCAYRGDLSAISVDPDEGNTHTVKSLQEMFESNLGLKFVGENGYMLELERHTEVFIAGLNEYGAALLGFEVDHRNGYDVWIPIGLLD